MIRKFRQLGWDGPETKGKGRGPHAEIMRLGEHKVTLPNVHPGSELDGSLVDRVIKRADIALEEWNEA